MGRPPAYVFIVRHGNRLDAADKQWHLSSPTPYDPPLTYGGWLQSRMVGARIASIIQDRETEEEAAAAINQTPRKRRRYNVILHSSPFLRCVQTSIAISSGLALEPSSSPSRTPTGGQSPRTKPTRVNQISSFSNPAPSRTRPALPAETESNSTTQNPIHIKRSVLRLDPFLGEWASPDYFDHITPPPRSALMLASAKAELLRKEDYNNYAHFNAKPVPSTPSALWNSPSLRSPLATHAESADDNHTGSPGLDSLSKLDEALPSPALKSPWGAPRRGSASTIPVGYSAPTPPYAVSVTDPIPVGYVAHARDACVDVDYQWDSSRDNLAWGDGGILPEEWAAMHQRFRKGLKRLVEWYSTTDRPGEMVTKTSCMVKMPKGNGAQSGCAIDEGDDDVETENIVVLVSHGAGCNALVGGVTAQPVLADVAMSSLTVARRRPAYDDVNSIDPSALASLDDAFSRRKMSIPDMYEMTLFANSDHLVPGAGSLSRSSSINGGARGRFNGPLSPALREVGLGSQYGQTSPVHRSNSVNASLGSMRRSSQATSFSSRANQADKGGITVGSGVTTFIKSARSNSIGLWEPPQEAEKTQDDLPLTLNFEHEKEATKPAPLDLNKATDEKEKSNGHLPVQPPETAIVDSADEKTSKPASQERDASDRASSPSLWGGGSGSGSGGGGGLWGHTAATRRSRADTRSVVEQETVDR
ncbi:phosphoglycerate mutase [Apiospora arundinis]